MRRFKNKLNLSIFWMSRYQKDSKCCHASLGLIKNKISNSNTNIQLTTTPHHGEISWTNWAPNCPAVLIKDIRGEELAPNFTIRADMNFVDLHSFVEWPKFRKTFPHLLDFLSCINFDIIGQVSFSFYHLFNIFCRVNCHGRTFHIWTLL